MNGLKTQDARLKTAVGKGCVLLLFLGSWVSGLGSVAAGPLPSLFRGVVVVDHPLGVRVVSVEESSQAALADLRSDDVLVQLNDTAIKTIDEFAMVSLALRGQAVKARVVVLRDGQPRELFVHLYSYPLLRQWELYFVPEHDLRFIEPKAGLAYWLRLARGLETAHDPEPALNAYLNALHQDPAQLDVAVQAEELMWEMARARLAQHRLPDALAALEQGTTLLRHLFDHPLDGVQLELVKHQLQETLALLRAAHHGAS